MFRSMALARQVTQRCFSTSLFPHQAVNHVTVLGAGSMGSGIAQVLSQNVQCNVNVVDINENQLTGMMKGIEKQLARSVDKGKLNQEESSAILGRIQTNTSIESASESDVVIEAVTENPSVKESIFNQLCDLTGPDTILATNTSTISITRIGGSIPRADKLVGMHFFNPVPVMPLVEVIKGLATSQDTVERTVALANAMKKVPIECGDSTAFVVNRLLLPYLNEAIALLAEGSASAKDIDTCLKLGTNVPMGPLTLADFVGLDVCLHCLRVMEEELGPKYKPHPLLVKYVNAGWLGRKSGRGFHDYSV